MTSKLETRFKCAVCGKITAGRIGRDGRHVGDGSGRYPRRHNVDGKPCLGNIQEAEWVDVLVSVNERDRKLLEFAERYHTLTEAYDRTVCSGPIVKGAIYPETPQQAALIDSNARTVLQDLARQAEPHQITLEELRRAIHAHRPKNK
jgi:hypothetical protein